VVSECFIYSYCYLLQLADECEERQEKEPLVVVLDSMGGRQDAAVQDILEYLTDEWTKNTFIDKSTAAFPFDMTEMAIITPKCPKRPDYTSCGLYLIQFE
jgi:Ulp1 family protease